MVQETQSVEKPGQSPDFQQKIQELREMYADATELQKTALENILRDMQSGAAGEQAGQSGVPQQRAGENPSRKGSRRGKVSELTVIAPLRPGGAARLRAFLQTLHGSVGNQGVDKVGTVHDMRFVFIDNDTRLLFCTAYDTDWDAYIDDFATLIPDILDLQFGELEGWPGVRSPQVKDFIVDHEVTADFWYVAVPELTVAETKRLQHVGQAVDEFLDNIG
jgi:hypothetical protein